MAKHKHLFSLAAVASLFVACGAHAGLAAGASFDDTAKALAGLPPSAGSPLASLADDPTWKLHAKAFNAAWDGLDKRQLAKVRSWASANLPGQKSTLFYMFSGPDFMYADTFFPNVTTYIMSGLEPPGRVPDFVKMSKGEIGASMAELRNSLGSVMNYSFFITNHMRVDLNQGRIVGTLPVLMVFLERTGKTITDVSFVDLTSDGVSHAAEEKVAGATAKGVKITFMDNVGKRKTLYYFSTDVSNKGTANSGFLKFCANYGQGDALVKSASYLMHNQTFSTVREFLLSHADALLQDDSGVPIRFLDKGWKLQPYGAYVGPIPVFRGQTQSVMYSLFAKGRAKPLDFGIGYRFRPMQSNLLLAIKDPNASAADILGKPIVGAQKAATHVNGDAKPAPARTYVRRRTGTNTTASNPFPKLFGYSQ